MDDDDWDALIDEAAQAPKKVTGDAGSVEMHSLDELLKARAARADGVANPARGLRFTKLVPPGAV